MPLPIWWKCNKRKSWQRKGHPAKPTHTLNPPFPSHPYPPPSPPKIHSVSQTFPHRPFLGVKPGPTVPYQWTTYGEFGEMVDKAKALLREAGIGPGDKVAVFSRNRVEWAVGCMASLGLGATWVPMYEQQRLKEVEYILKDSGAKLLLVGSEEMYDKTRHLLQGGLVPALQDIWTFDVDVPARMARVTPALVAQANAQPPTIQPDHVACLIYTSGTTGTPKGVELTHGNLCSNIHGMLEVVRVEDMPDARSLSFLPWAHSIGLNCELFNMMSRGAQVALAQDITTIATDIKEVQPNLLFAVPTLYKKVYDRIQEKVTAKGYFSRWLVDTAVAVAERRLAVLRTGDSPGFLLQMQYAMLDRAVLSKLRETLGGRVRLSPVGGSKMSANVTRFFEAALGIAILEGYGLSETSPLLSIGRAQIQLRRVGSVGQAVKGAEIVVVRDGVRVGAGEEGEVWAAGPMVFKGYLNKAEETAAAFGELDGKRYFRTGDLGTLCTQGFLTITGRLKELYKLENGKYVCAPLVEKALLESEYIFQVVLHGADMPFNVALIVPNWEKLTAWAVANEVPGLSLSPTKAELHDNPAVQAFMRENIVLACKDKVKKYEMPLEWLLLAEPFTVENEMLTPKMSIKRHAVVKAYAPAIEAIYEKAGAESSAKARAKEGATNPHGSVAEPLAA